jgi:Xaa-Pro aminopeptidase
MDTRSHPIRDRLAALQQTLAEHTADALLILSSDPHLSEYLPARWQGREWFSGFTGSMGTLVVTREDAVLFADSRYWEQAERELAGSGIELVRIATGSAAAHVEWLAEHLHGGQLVMVDGAVIGVAAAQQLHKALQARGIRLRTDADMLDQAWPQRPPLPAAALYAHAPPHAARSRLDKIASVREAMRRHGATHHFVSTLDDIAWITNLRGADVPYNPVFLAHLLIGPQAVTLFVGHGKLGAALLEMLRSDGIAVADYAEARATLGTLTGEDILLLDPRRVTLAFREAVPGSVKVIEAINPSTLAKSRKTEAEAGFVREAMAWDAAAMCRFYAWLEARLGRAAISELTIDERLSAERARHPDFVSLSFPTIAGFNANGALPHYRAMPEAHAQISRPDGLVAEGLLLIDSGAQYLGGTTDITRVWPIGTPSAAQKRDFTLVLKGMVALSRARFPLGTLSTALDALARAPLWSEQIDFAHGTGHGVGYFLNVHEGPQSISRAATDANMAMQPGMITSNEPGVYRPGRWGVRIENLLLNVPAAGPGDEFGDFLEFETLTLCPIDTRCIDKGLLREDERAWLDAYHRTVRERVAPRVDGDARAWLEARTAAL